MKYQAHNLEHVYFVSNIPNHKINLPSNATHLDYNSVASSRSQGLLQLIDSWNADGFTKANYYPIERLCFLRWLVLADLFSSKIIPCGLIVSVDWDNLLLCTPTLPITVNHNEPISFHAYTVGDTLAAPLEIHPAFSILNSQTAGLYSSMLHRAFNIYR